MVLQTYTQRNQILLPHSPYDINPMRSVWEELAKKINRRFLDEPTLFDLDQNREMSRLYSALDEEWHRLEEDGRFVTSLISSFAIDLKVLKVLQGDRIENPRERMSYVFWPIRFLYHGVYRFNFTRLL